MILSRRVSLRPFRSLTSLGCLLAAAAAPLATACSSAGPSDPQSTGGAGASVAGGGAAGGSGTTTTHGGGGGTDASVGGGAAGETDASVGTLPGIDPLPDAAADVAPKRIVIAPDHAVLEALVVDGVVTRVSWAALPEGGLFADAGENVTPTFSATYEDGSRVPAAWSLDRGELGSIVASSGVLTLSGHATGAAKIVATYAGSEASAELTVRVHAIQNGAPAGSAPVSPPAIGSVGGRPLGAKVDEPAMTALREHAAAPASAAELSWLYPYDGTVWPRGVVAPLLQWRTSRPARAVYVHLRETNYEFEGFYAGSQLDNMPIAADAWSQALAGNKGEPLRAEVTILDGANAIGPIAEAWKVSRGVLKGTVYYNSYRTTLAEPVENTAGAPAAGVLAIRPGASEPVLALPGARRRCVVCHEVSDDGSTMFVQEGKLPEDYSEGTSYDLKTGNVIKSYTGTAPDGTLNDRKFLWSAPWADGTFQLQSSQHTPEAYYGDSRIFRRDDASAMPAPGFDDVVAQAVTPSFSRDGKSLAFNFWKGKTSGTGGDGHTLDVMSFACGPVSTAAPGGPSCGTFTFSNLRRLYTNPDQVNGFVGWPAWLPDSTGIVFHNTLVTPDAGSPISTWKNAKAELWYTDVPASPDAPAHPIRLNALNGLDPSGVSYLPRAEGNAFHDDDHRMNYEPTVNPIASGGYDWVVFTSRRMYGNVAVGDPYDTGDGTYPIPKKLWVAAIDKSAAPGVDPSHPAFYLPGQELNAGNMRGFWVVDPCHSDGAGCETGDECCNGYCQRGVDDKLTCASKPRSDGCSQEFEKCSAKVDCCGSNQGYDCINGRCAGVATEIR